jgi:hypothetical protein
MSSVGSHINFRTPLGFTVALFLVLLQVTAAQASSEISIFLVSKNKNATVEDALLSVPVFGKLLGDKLENQALIIQKKKEENLIFFLGKAKAYPKNKTQLSVISGNTEYRFNLSSESFKKRAANSNVAWETINLISIYNSSVVSGNAGEVASDLEATIKDLNEKLNDQKTIAITLKSEVNNLKSENRDLMSAKEGIDLNKDTTVQNLRDTIDELKSEKAELAASLNKKSDELSKIQEKLERSKDIVADETRSAKNEIVNFDSDPRVVALNARIKELETLINTSNSVGGRDMAETATLQVDGTAVNTGSTNGITFEFVELAKPKYDDGCEVTFKVTNATGQTLQDLAFSDTFKFYDIDGDALSKKSGDRIYLRYEDKLKDGQHFTDSVTVDRQCTSLGDIELRPQERSFVLCRDRKAEKIDCEQFIASSLGTKVRTFNGDFAKQTEIEAHSAEKNRVAESSKSSDTENVPDLNCIEGDTKGPFGLAFGASPGCLGLETADLFSSKHEHDYYSDERACRRETNGFISQERPNELVTFNLDDGSELPVKYGLVKLQILNKERNVCVYFNRSKLYKIFINSPEFNSTESKLIKSSLDDKYVKGRGYFTSPRTNLSITLGSQTGSIKSGLSGKSDDWSSADKKIAINKRLFCSSLCIGGLTYESVDLARAALEDVMSTLTNQKQNALKQSNF